MDKSEASTLQWSTSASAEVDLHAQRTRGNDAFPCRFGGYELLGQLGKGGMGVVFKARQLEAQRTVALKVIRPEKMAAMLAEDRENALGRFRNEVLAAARLVHDHVVTVYDVGEIAGQPYYAMRYVDGQSLNEMLRNGPLPNEQAARYAEHIAQALAHAHQEGILHRDLKPHNVMVDAKTDRALLADFGLAKLSESDQQLTASEAVFGSPPWMSPEQAQDAGRVTEATDIYGLGAILFHLLTGRPPFQAAKPHETLLQVQTQDPIAPRALNPGVHRDLETIVLKCLEKNPQRRYRSASEVALELQRYLRGDPVRARPRSAAERVWRWAKRHPAISISTAVITVSLLGALVWWQSRPAYLDLRVTPASAHVRVGDNAIELVDGRAFVSLSPGRYRVHADAADYVARQQEVALARGRENTAILNLELPPKYGYFELSSDPDGAVVVVLDSSGQEVVRGYTRFNSPRLPSGKYTVLVQKELHDAVELSTSIPTGNELLVMPPVRLKFQAEDDDRSFLRKFDAVLEHSVGPFDFVETPLAVVADKLAKASGISIIIDVKAIEQVGIGAETPITHRLAKTTLRSALELILHDMDLTFTPRSESTVEITTFEVTKTQHYSITYSVADLVAIEGAFPNDLEGLKRSIESDVAPDTWDTVGGPGQVRILSALKAIVVSQTLFNHGLVDQHLSELRRARIIRDSTFTEPVTDK